MSFSHPRGPLHGITLKTINKALVERSVWAERGLRVPIPCFLHDPRVKSSLTFLRPPRGRERVGGWYIAYKKYVSKNVGFIHPDLSESRSYNSMASNAAIFKATLQIADVDRRARV